MLVAVVVLPTNYLQGMQVSVGVTALLFGVLAFSLYLASLRGHFFPAALWLALMASATIALVPQRRFQRKRGLLLLPGLDVRGGLVWRRQTLGPHIPGLCQRRRPAMGRSPMAGRWRRRLPGPATAWRDLHGFAGSGLGIVMMCWVLVRVYQRDRARLSETATALAQSQAQLSEMFALNPDAVAMMDAATQQILEINPAMERLTGWGREQVIGKTTTVDFQSG